MLYSCTHVAPLGVKGLSCCSSAVCGIQAAMKDKWLNSGYHGEDLQPYIESSHKLDHDRVGKYHIDWCLL